MTIPHQQSKLEKAIDRVERAIPLAEQTHCNHFWSGDIKELLSAAKRSIDLEQEHDEEIGEFQDQVRDRIIKMEPRCNPDGAGCESGDWRDFTLAEIGQGMAFVIDERDELRQKLAAVEKERDELKATITTITTDKDYEG